VRGATDDERARPGGRAGLAAEPGHETAVERLMANGVDVHAGIGPAAIDAALAARDPILRLTALMRSGEVPRLRRLRPLDATAAPVELAPIDSGRCWSLVQRGLAALALLALLPLLPAVWLGVKLSSPGPLLFRQRRRGRGGEPFVILKFRSLCADAERQTVLGVTQAAPQITRFGRLLRQTKIDELPQLWNVVRGEMELVGPRPIPIGLEDRLRQEIQGFTERNRVKPGLTSFAQVAVVDNRVGDDLVQDWRERFEAERHYIRRKSFAYDLVVLGMSVLYLLRSALRVVRGAARAAPRAGRPTATEVLGVPIADLSMRDVVERIAGWIEEGRPRYVAFCPVHSVVEAARSPAHRQALLGAGLCAADGMPIVWAQRLLGHRDAERIYGPTTMLRALERAEQEGWRVLLYGGHPERLERLVGRLRERFPGLRIVEALSPPFRALTPEEDEATTARLAALQPDLTLVGLGCPKQERWMADHSGRIPGVMLGVGAAFDFHAGAVRQAPALLQGLGLEWAFRLACEPRRLFRRYATTNPYFVGAFGLQWAKRCVLRRRYRVELGAAPAKPGPRRRARPRPAPDAGLVPKPSGPELAVCIASFRRPELLRGTLKSLAEIDLPGGIEQIEIRVVDNDAERSAEDVVQAFAALRLPGLRVRYAVEPERNIALARNRALELGPAQRVAFIDDDERADRHWLRGLWDAQQAGRADAAFGRVEAILPDDAPAWIQRGRFLDKAAGPEGIDLAWERTRTSSALVDGAWFYEFGYRFDPRFGRSGGEDTDLFRRIAAAGGRFRAAPASAVREFAHAEQCRVRWVLRRAWRGGANYERLIAAESRWYAPPLRFLKRLAIGLPLACGAIPAALRGQREHLVGALQTLALAGGGLQGWLLPRALERGRGYRSSGTLGQGHEQGQART
jgi:N-acetylglucosaminyldiphosphoundecaprenol N-acetyl-beta-D-mannosaminyltransferase